MTTSTDRSPVTDADANLFGRAVASGGFGFILIDCDGKVLAANSPACELLGGRQDELVGTTIANLIHPDDRGWSEAELALLFAGGVDRVRQAVRLVAVDGREVGVELT